MVKIALKTKNKAKHKRALFIFSSFVISLVALILIIINFRSSIIFFYSPTELKNLPNLPTKIIRVGGLVKEGSINHDLEKGLIFTITDLENDLVINFKGIKPDLFREGQGMLAKGKIDQKTNEFEAQELLAKHDENYMPPEVKKSLKGENYSKGLEK